VSSPHTSQPDSLSSYFSQFLTSVKSLSSTSIGQQLCCRRPRASKRSTGHVFSSIWSTPSIWMCPCRMAVGAVVNAHCGGTQCAVIGLFPRPSFTTKNVSDEIIVSNGDINANACMVRLALRFWRRRKIVKSVNSRTLSISMRMHSAQMLDMVWRYGTPANWILGPGYRIPRTLGLCFDELHTWSRTPTAPEQTHVAQVLPSHCRLPWKWVLFVSLGAWSISS